jgi:hypothetical protein
MDLHPYCSCNNIAKVIGTRSLMLQICILTSVWMGPVDVFCYVLLQEWMMVINDYDSLA